MKEGYKRILTVCVLLPLAILVVAHPSTIASFIFYIPFSALLLYEISSFLPTANAKQRQLLNISQAFLFLFLFVFIAIEITLQLTSPRDAFLAEKFLSRYIPLFFLLFAIACTIAVLSRNTKDSEENIEQLRFNQRLFFHTLFSYAVATYFAYSLVRIKHFPAENVETNMISTGQAYLLFVLFLTWLYDSLAYVFGKHIGGRKLGLAVSTKKTFAGLIVGGISTWIVLFGLRHTLAEMPLGGNNTVLADHSIFKNPLFFTLTVLLLIAIAQIGDLLASLMKRVAKVKDSGKLLPGHGGVYDRTDALLLVSATLCELLFLI